MHLFSFSNLSIILLGLGSVVNSSPSYDYGNKNICYLPSSLTLPTKKALNCGGGDLSSPYPGGRYHIKQLILAKGNIIYGCKAPAGYSYNPPPPKPYFKGFEADLYYFNCLAKRNYPRIHDVAKQCEKKSGRDLDTYLYNTDVSIQKFGSIKYTDSNKSFVLKFYEYGKLIVITGKVVEEKDLGNGTLITWKKCSISGHKDYKYAYIVHVSGGDPPRRCTAGKDTYVPFSAEIYLIK